MSTTTRAELVRYLRVGRGFVAEQVLEAKLGRLRAWFRENDLDAAVVGVSGGVDSAVTLGLLCGVGAPVQLVTPLLLPIDGPGTTNQGQADRRARLVCDAFGVEPWVAPLADAHLATMGALAGASGLPFDGWSAGQLASVVRTPALYGAVALLRAHGHRPVVVGTTNRDEGAYLGFFGKASDGMVDLQPISDLHKSEVVALAALLGVPQEVIDAEPNGDVWDGRNDAQMIGAGYDDVEIVLRLRELRRDPGASDAAAAIEALHRENAHKYRVGSPAVHLDVLPRGVPGGWPDEAISQRFEVPPPIDAVPGWWVAPPTLRLPPVTDSLPHVQHLDDGIVVASDVLTADECDRLVAAMDAVQTLEPVGVTGVRDAYGVGSQRATAWAPLLAGDLWQRLHPAVASVRFLDADDATDGHATADRDGHRTWRVVGLSPLLRFMRYEPGGQHLVHYDAGYDYGDGRRTLASVVWYLQRGEGERGGSTRFVRDGQEHLPVWSRDHRDWDRATRPDEVRLAVPPVPGSALVFDHRLPHDVEAWHGPGSRVIVRADVVYEAVPDGRSLP